MIQSALQHASDDLQQRFGELKQRMKSLPAGAEELCAQMTRTLEHVVELLGQAASRQALADSFIHIAGVILVALEADGRITTINQEGARMLGYGADDLIGQDWFKTCIPADQRQDVRKVFDTLMAGNVPAAQHYENGVQTRTGQTLTIAWHNTVVRRNGQISGTLSSGQDITAQRTAQQAVVDREARLRAVVNTAVDCIITIDERGTIESVNPATEHMFGYMAGELVGQNIRLLMPPPYHDEHDEYLSRYLKTGRKRIIGIGREAVARRKDGTNFPIDLAVSEVHIAGQRLFTGIVRDIADRKDLERQVLQISTQEQQRIGRDLHDGLGQQLTGIAFLTEVLQRSMASQSRREAADAAEIVKLVNQAIDHTRALVRGLCPVNLEAEGLMIALQQLAESVEDLHGVTCTFDCDRPVHVDDHQTATHLYYIANESVNNALRHGKPSRITISLAEDKRRTTLSISDDGAGIPAERQGGNGRGLHIMTYRARMIGGRLEVQSEPGQGTRVACSFHLSPPKPIRPNHDDPESTSTVKSAGVR